MIAGDFMKSILWIMPWMLNYLFLIIPFGMGTIISVVDTEGVTQTFSWRQSNPEFIEDNGAILTIAEGSNLDIFCPYNVTEYYKLFIVPADMFNNCFIPSNSTVRPFLTCNNPGTVRHFTINIKAFQPVPFLPDFLAGNNYYFITPSSGSLHGINNTYAGACSNNDMKLNISVVNATENTNSSTSTSTSSTQTTSQPTGTGNTSSTTTTTSTMTTNSTSTTTQSTSTGTTSADIPIIIAGTDGNTGVIEASHATPTVSIHWTHVYACLVLVYLANKLDR